MAHLPISLLVTTPNSFMSSEDGTIAQRSKTKDSMNKINSVVSTYELYFKIWQ